MGKGVVLLIAPHSTGPDADLHAGPIVEEAALLSKCYAVIGKVSRDYLDLNRIQSAKSDFRKAIQDFLDEYGVKCILDIRGKRDQGVDIGTAQGESASQSTTDTVQGILSKNFTVTLNADHFGTEPGSIITTYNQKDAEGRFSLEALQIEIGHEERTFQKDKIVSSIADIVSVLNQKLDFSMTDEGTSDDLDEAYPRLGEESDGEDEPSRNP